MMGYGGMAGGMWLFSLLVVAALLALGYLALRTATGGRPGAGPPAGEASDAARRLLDERYARGEIDEEEYRRRRDGLR